MITRIDHLSCEERLRELQFFSPEKRRLKDDLIVAFQYLREAYKKDEHHLEVYLEEHEHRARGNGFKLKDSRFRLDIWKESRFLG